MFKVWKKGYVVRSESDIYTDEDLGQVLSLHGSTYFGFQAPLGVDTTQHFYSVSGEPKHLHIYRSLRTGDSRVKEFQFTDQFQNFCVSFPEADANVFFYYLHLVRPALKLSFFPPSYRTLKTLADNMADFDLARGKLRQLPAAQIEFLNEQSGGYLREVVDSDRQSPLYLARLGFRLRAHFCRVGLLALKHPTLSYFREVLIHSLRVLFRAKKIALCGGSSIAITGADGSGKSTLSAALAEFGAGKGIVTFHYGLPSLTVIDRLKNRLLLRRALDSSSKEKKKSLASEKANESLFRKIYHVDLAYRRWRTAAVAKLLTHWGYVVVFDRYLNVNGGIDGPDLKSISGFLQGAEKFFYRNTHPVDLVIRLDYSTDVLVKRNRERNKEFKESDSEIIQRANKFADTTYLGKRELRVTDPNLDCDTLVEATLLELFGAKKNV